MPYAIEVRQTQILWINLSGELEIEELAEVNEVVVNDYLSGDLDYYIVYDVSGLQKFPMNARKLSDISTIGKSDRVLYQIIYGIQNPLVDFLFKVIANVFGRNQRVLRYSSEEEVMAFLSRTIEKESVE